MATDNMSQHRTRNWKLNSSNKHIYCLLTFTVFCIACLISGIIVGFFLRVKDFNGDTQDDIAKDPSVRTVQIITDLFSVDPMSKTMGMNWLISNDSCLVYADQICTVVEIFFDLNLLQLGDSSKTNLTNQVASTPIFTWDPCASRDDRSGVPLFSTTSTLIDAEVRQRGSTLQDYPFDTYGTDLFVFAVDEVNDAININVFTSGIAVGFKSISNATTDDFNGAYNDNILLVRSGLIKSYVMCIIIGIWLVTLAFVGSAMKIMFNYKQPKEVFAVPIASLFAFTSLRASMPGAPTGFGATIDFVGILPCLAIITTTSVVLFGYMVIQANEGNKEIAYAPAEFFQWSDKGKQDLEAKAGLSSSDNEPPVNVTPIVLPSGDVTPPPLNTGDSGSTLVTDNHANSGQLGVGKVSGHADATEGGKSEDTADVTFGRKVTEQLHVPLDRTTAGSGSNFVTDNPSNSELQGVGSVMENATHTTETGKIEEEASGNPAVGISEAPEVKVTGMSPPGDGGLRVRRLPDTPLDSAGSSSANSRAELDILSVDKVADHQKDA